MFFKDPSNNNLEFKARMPRVGMPAPGTPFSHTADSTLFSQQTGSLARCPPFTPQAMRNPDYLFQKQ
jgi:hypothetical protein